MHRLTRSAVPAAALAALLLGAGCSGAPPTTPIPETGPTAESVAWVDGVCGTLKPLSETTAAGPQPGGADAAAAVRSLSEYFGRIATTLDGAITGLGSAPPSPVAGGDQIITTMTGDYTTLRTSVQDAKAKVDAVDVGNPQALATALPAAVEGLPSSFDPTAQLRTNPELGRAVDAAANCQALPAAGN